MKALSPNMPRNPHVRSDPADFATLARALPCVREEAIREARAFFSNFFLRPKSFACRDVRRTLGRASGVLNPSACKMACALLCCVPTSFNNSWGGK